MQELYLSGVVFVNTEGFRGVLAAYDAAHTPKYGCTVTSYAAYYTGTDVGASRLAASRVARKERGRKEGGELSLAGYTQLPVGGFTLVSLPPLARARSKQECVLRRNTAEKFWKTVLLSFGSQRDTHRNHRAAFVFPSSKTRCGTNRTCMYTEYLMVMVTAVFVCV